MLILLHQVEEADCPRKKAFGLPVVQVGGTKNH